jgi:hypothetical protein
MHNKVAKLPEFPLSLPLAGAFALAPAPSLPISLALHIQNIRNILVNKLIVQ